MAQGPTTLALPPFSGATRRLILLNLAAFFGFALLGLILSGHVFAGIMANLSLVPFLLFHGEIWQLVTYAFLPLGILGTAFALLTLWFTGSILESEYSPRWLYELYFTSAIGGALLAALTTLTRFRGLSPTGQSVVGIGPYAAIYGLLIAIALRMGDLEFFLFFLIRVKARYMVAIYVLIDLATLLKADQFFDALLHLSGALCGFLYLRFVPRRGLAYAVTERYFALRNDFYRAKRRRAARKFEVYMGKQGRDDVRFDKEGRYIDPDRDRSPRDQNDKRWMN